MSEIAIRVEGLGKEYQIGARQERYRTFRDVIWESFSAPARRIRGVLAGRAGATMDCHDSIWALQDVSFEIRPGEVVGLIGRNGAGKSTLLKLLSRITEPTAGFAEVRGRVASLLEVGTGFHPELTGRENIYLNGAILGMRKVEIERKFDEIVDFAEIEKFLDTPVKHYSSGMYVRLAFAVAAHLEPEVLVVDEVLAVGDMEFQKKCLNKMEDVGQHGRTIVFVSHNMRAIARLCDRALLLGGGTVLRDGPVQQVISEYLHSDLDTTAAREWLNPDVAPRGDVARLCAVRVRDEDGRIPEILDIRRPISLELEFEVLRPGSILMPTFLLFNEEDVQLFAAHDLDPAWRGVPRPLGRYVSTCLIPGNFLSEGRVFVDAGVTTLAPVVTQFIERNAIAFQVVDTYQKDSARGDWPGEIGGAVRPLLEWQTRFTPVGRGSPVLTTHESLL